MKFTIATLMVLTLVAAICLAVYSKLHPPKASVVLEKIEHLSRDNPTLDVGLRAVTFDPRGEYTRFISHIENDYYLQTKVQVTSDSGKNTLVGAAVIKHVSMGTWEYVFPIFLDGDVVWEYDSKVDDPFGYQHLVAKPGGNCFCPDCQSQKTDRITNR